MCFLRNQGTVSYTHLDVYKRQDVHAPDLRAGAALVIAGLSAKGFTTVSDIGYMYRGYEQFEQKLKQLGGEIQLVNNEKEVAKFKLKIG